MGLRAGAAAHRCVHPVAPLTSVSALGDREYAWGISRPPGWVFLPSLALVVEHRLCGPVPAMTCWRVRQGILERSSWIKDRLHYVLRGTADRASGTTGSSETQVATWPTAAGKANMATLRSS